MDISEYNQYLNTMFLKNEIWKSIPEYPNYQISNLGRVKSLASTTPMIRKIELNRGGYQHVKLRRDGKNKLVRVHRLVANSFVPNLNHFDQIDYIDGDKQNNNFKNLRWCSKSTNIKHIYELNPDFQKSKRKAIVATSNSKMIFFPSITKSAEFISSHISKHTIGAALSTIYQALNNNDKSAYGFTWKSG